MAPEGDGVVIASTARIRIRTIRLEDAPFILKLVNSPGWIEFIGDRQVSNLDEAEEFLRGGLLEVYAEHGFGYYCVEDLQGTPMGIAGFLKKPFLEYEDFGFAFLPQFHGRGFAFEASQPIIDYGVRELGFVALDAVTLPNNSSSIGLLEKLGFNYLTLVEDTRSGDTVSLYRRLSQC